MSNHGLAIKREKVRREEKKDVPGRDQPPRGDGLSSDQTAPVASATCSAHW